MPILPNDRLWANDVSADYARALAPLCAHDGRCVLVATESRSSLRRAASDERSVVGCWSSRCLIASALVCARSVGGHAAQRSAADDGGRRERQYQRSAGNGRRRRAGALRRRSRPAAPRRHGRGMSSSSSSSYSPSSSQRTTRRRAGRAVYGLVLGDRARPARRADALASGARATLPFVRCSRRRATQLERRVQEPNAADDVDDDVRELAAAVRGRVGCAALSVALSTHMRARTDRQRSEPAQRAAAGQAALSAHISLRHRAAGRPPLCARSRRRPGALQVRARVPRVRLVG